ncbi:MAG TPA: acyl-CoA synthetase, partial [Gammaproteobacteria bacterium]|nr:acyl-CoA synthetase [Gammaproteobacteria bacterium]
AIFNLKAGEGAHLVTGPLYHTAPGAFGMGSLHMGHALVLMNKWEPEETLKLIDQYKITVSHMVPTMFYRMLSLPDEVKNKYDLGSLECVIHGAAPITIEGKKNMIDWWGPVLFEYYGATEGAGSFVGSEEWLTKPGTVCKPMTAGSVVILDEQGNPLPANQAGEIFLTPVMDFEYFKDKGKTEKSRSRDGLFTVGDVGYLDDDGYLFLCDRKNDMIISGGVNIYPAEVEKTLVLHGAVHDVAVFGIPDEDWGESVKAVVQLNPGYQASTELVEELLAFSKQNLAKYKLPRSIDFVDELPRLDTGKLYKRILRDKYWQDKEKSI